MSKLPLFILSILASVIVYSCRRSEPPPPDTPEKVVQAYQGFIDNNEFEKAKELSTPEEQERIDGIASIIANEMADSTLLNTVFLSINCSQEADTAICICQVKDEYEEYETEYLLVRVNGQWLVDAPQEEIIIDDEIIEEFLYDETEGAEETEEDTIME